MNLRSALYRSARLLGDAQAIRRGPSAVVARLARSTLLRALGGAVNALVRKAGR